MDTRWGNVGSSWGLGERGGVERLGDFGGGVGGTDSLSDSAMIVYASESVGVVGGRGKQDSRRAGIDGTRNGEGTRKSASSAAYQAEMDSRSSGSSFTGGGVSDGSAGWDRFVCLVI
jgi:hypothetical protein